MRVAAAGGRPEPATTLDEGQQETHHLYPSFLPDGRHFVFYVAGKTRGLYVGQSDSAERTFLFDPDPALPTGAAATPGVYAASGHLLYVRDRVLMARPFDASSRAVAGAAVKVADTVDYSPPGRGGVHNRWTRARLSTAPASTAGDAGLGRSNREEKSAPSRRRPARSGRYR